jgi:hypothetical protein
MRVILHICCQMQPKSSSLCYVNSGPNQTQYNYSSCHSDLSIKLNVSPLRLMVYRQINARNTPHLLPNTQHNIRFTLCQLWSRSNPIQLHFLIFILQYSIECISAAIGCLSTNRCVLYFTFSANYRAQYPVYAMPTLAPVKSNIITVLLMQASTFNWTYLRCDWWFIDKSMRAILHIYCRMQPNSTRLRNVKSGPTQIQCNYSSSYTGFNIQLNISPTRLVVYRHIYARYTPHLLPNAA